MSEISVRATGSIVQRVLHPIRFQRMFDDAMDEAGKKAQVIFRVYAGKRHGRSREPRSGRLVEGVHTTVQGNTILLSAEAKNPTTGFDYVGVTRFGHKGPILARPGGVLRIPMAGKVLYRRSTKGFHPATDWAEDALPEVLASADQVLGKLARRIEATN